MARIKNGVRGAGKQAEMNVPFDKWGEMKNLEEIRDGDTIIGYTSDEYRYITEPDIRKITKKEILEDIEGWRDDNGMYGDADTAIYFAYKDGSFVDAADLDGKAFKKSGLVGVSISTGDYEMVWGGEINKKTGEIVPWRTHEWDDETNEELEGHTNSYSGYKTVAQYKVRVRTLYNIPNGRGGWKMKREIIRRSTTVPTR